MGLKEIQAIAAARTGNKKAAAKTEGGTKTASNPVGTRVKNSGTGKAPIKKGPRKRSKKMAKKMRKLGKINKELLGDSTGDLTELCEIQSPVCTRIATVLNHNEGREGDNLLDKSKMTKCCPPCNDYIEAHHEWARERGFKALRHGKK